MQPAIILTWQHFYFIFPEVRICKLWLAADGSRYTSDPGGNMASQALLMMCISFLTSWKPGKWCIRFLFFLDILLDHNIPDMTHDSECCGPSISDTLFRLYGSVSDIGRITICVIV